MFIVQCTPLPQYCLSVTAHSSNLQAIVFSSTISPPINPALQGCGMNIQSMSNRVTDGVQREWNFSRQHVFSRRTCSMYMTKECFGNYSVQAKFNRNDRQVLLLNAYATDAGLFYLPNLLHPFPTFFCGLISQTKPRLLRNGAFMP